LDKLGIYPAELIQHRWMSDRFEYIINSGRVALAEILCATGFASAQFDNIKTFVRLIC